MFGKHVTGHLSPFVHGELSDAERLRIDAHLRECSECRAAYEEIRFGSQLAASLPLSKAPESIWSGMAEHPALCPPSRGTAAAGGRGSRLPLAQFLAVGAAVVVLFAVGERLLRSPDPEAPSWEVQRVRGTPRAGGENVAETGRLRAGEALHTDASSEALVKIADIGQLTLDPNTTIRLLVTRPDQHRISLDHGKLEALTWAPPRLFVVETPTAAAVDLGCRYTLEVEKDGGSLLHVTLGVVALQRGDRETVVPAGAFCRTRPKKGPGAPFFEDASEKLRTALDYVDFGSDDEERVRRLRVVIEESRERDALTLWHLLTRLDATSRALLYDRIAEMAPPPSEVTRDGIIALDPHMLDLWKERVAQLW